MYTLVKVPIFYSVEVTDLSYGMIDKCDDTPVMSHW